MAGKIVVVGSFVYDLVVWVPYFPRQGETLVATDFKMYAGGKGFNQAISARRCGAEVGMVGKLGTDQFGDAFVNLLDQEGIEHEFVVQDASTSTSLGIPMIDPQGENRIIGVPRANTRLTVGEIEAARSFICQHDMLLLQLEIPLEACLHAAYIAHQAGLQVIFNPAPASHPLPALLPRDNTGRPVIDWLVHNEIETEMLSGLPVKTPDEAIQAGQIILAQGVQLGVVITMGGRGAVAVTLSGPLHVSAFPATSLDPTGAGDAFCGAFAAALSEGQSLSQALRFANAAGAISITIAGAEPSLPRREAIECLLSRSP